jgi:hypothetical protein
MLLAKAVTMIFVYIEIKSTDEINQSMGGRPFVVVAKEALGFFKAVKTEIENNEIIKKEEE